LISSSLPAQIGNGLAAYVTRHDKYGILEVNRAAVTVGKAPIIKYLQQNVKDIG